MSYIKTFLAFIWLPALFLLALIVFTINPAIIAAIVVLATLVFLGFAGRELVKRHDDY